MGYRRRSGSTYGTPLNKSQSFMMRRIIIYLDRLLSHYGRLNPELLETIHWVLGPEIVEQELPHLVSLVENNLRKKSQERILEEVCEAEGFSSLIEEALKTSRSDLEEPLIDLLRDLLPLRIHELDYSGESAVEKNLSLFRNLFGLSLIETELVLFFCIVETWEEAENLFHYSLKCDRYVGRAQLATILNCRVSEIVQSINGRLCKIGIIERNRSGAVEIESEFLQLLLESGGDGLDTHFFKKIDPEKVLPLNAHGIDPEITAHALRLLSTENDRGNSLLLYGQPGVGKTTYAFGLAKALGLDIFLCKHEGKHREWERQVAVMSAINMASENPNALVIVDDCDSILGTNHLWILFGTYNDKKWLHDVLEANARVVFIVNDVRFIEESVIRRFSYSIHFKPFGRRQRIKLWKNILESHNVGDALSEKEIEELATGFDTTPGIIEQAVGRAGKAALSAGADVHKAIILALEAHESLRRGGRKVTRKTFDKNFTLEGLNVTGADLPELMEELEEFHEYLKSGQGEEIVTMSLLFHGPSGTGKSYLALHIAHLLDREVVLKRGSDLLGSYVGETEQNIRSAYEEAESKEAVLIIDEADSLIFNRDRAERSWELSFTNEFLNCMESFRGIQIYTTNRLSDLDAASLRRFNYKLEFDYLTPEGKTIFYKRLLAPLIPSSLDTTIEKELRGIPNLAPGDFNVVKTKFRFKGKGKISHEALIAALKEESKTKDVYGGKKVIGF